MRVAIAGSTGSIGKQTLEVVRAAGDSGKYQVVALSANSSVAEIVAQAQSFKPEVVVVGDPAARARHHHACHARVADNCARDFNRWTDWRLDRIYVQTQHGHQGLRHCYPWSRRCA